MLLLLAQVSSPAIPGDPLGSWVSAVLQGGALVLLAFVVIVLAPRSIKEAREERERRDAAFAGVIGAIQDRQDQRNEKLIESIDRQTEQLKRSQIDSATRIEAVVGNVCRHPRA